jgi:acyl-CoA synthetase (AMP-forming)/AMP-acid ligase II
VAIVNYFGSNEGASLTGAPRDVPDPAVRARYFPRAGVPGFDWTVSTARKISTRLVDLESGRDIEEAGVPGELRFAGPTIFSGYYRAPELTERAFDDRGYYRTGDLFEIGGEARQYYRYVGRAKDLVIRGGMNISSEEIENLIVAHPRVREVAVVGYPDDILGERVCACVVPADPAPLTLADLTGFLRDEKRIAVYKLPERLLIVDALPRNPVGKVLKRVLRERAAAMANA